VSAVEARAENLYGRVRSCQLCALARTRTLAVPGEGPLTSEIMFIGEAPGQNEDRQGRPFVGQAGAFLSELLAAAGLTREEVYICNVLKCRPPGNRDPLPGEIEACRDYLDEQIDLLDPLVIVTLGRYSMAKFFPNQTISRIHGSVKESAGRYYVPMFHPAAALHQASLRETILNDFRRLPALLDRARTKARAADAPVAAPVAPAPPAPAALQTDLFGDARPAAPVIEGMATAAAPEAADSQPVAAAQMRLF
jgi:DNA polymerase